MKVFVCKRREGYRGGLAVVAANTKEEAFEVFHSHPDYEDMLNRWDADDWHYEEDIKKCDSEYYPRDGWYEIPILSADTIVPKIIAEDGYSE
jgi:hypothetical protein